MPQPIPEGPPKPPKRDYTVLWELEASRQVRAGLLRKLLAGEKATP